MWGKVLVELGKTTLNKVAHVGSKIDPSSTFTQSNVDDLLHLGKIGKEIIKEVLF